MPEAFEESGFVFLKSTRQDNIHRKGVSVIISTSLASHIEDYNLIFERIMNGVNTKDDSITIFQV